MTKQVVGSNEGHEVMLLKPVSAGKFESNGRENWNRHVKNNKK